MNRRSFLERTSAGLLGTALDATGGQVSAQTAASPSDIVIDAGRATAAIEHLAVNELHSYLGRLTGQRILIVPSANRANAGGRIFVVGTAESHPLIAELGSKFSAAALGDEGYRLCKVERGGKPLTVIAGGGPSGVLYGVYRLLEEFGCSFHLYGDILPDQYQQLPEPNLDIEAHPRFAVRGMQLWCYWFCGRDHWSLRDYQRYLDQLPKLGLNLFDFPLYAYEPLYTNYQFRGTRPDGVRLFGFDTRLVRIGKQYFQGLGRFTCPDIPDNASQVECNQAAIRLMRQVFAHARTRGLKTCVGIEPANHVRREVVPSLPERDRYEGGALVSPSSESARELTRVRLQALVSAYPDCDYYSMWQSESGISRTTKGSPHPADVAFRERFQKYAGVLTGGDFDYLQWLLLCHRIMEEIKPGARLTTNGWGAEKIMAAADEILPKELVRSSIAAYEPQLTLDRGSLRFYEQTRGPKWHTTWAERDSRIWCVQHKTRANAEVLNGLERRQVSGVGLLHWRNLYCDLDITYFARRCWEPELAPEAHWRRWINEKFGAEPTEPLVAALSALEDLSLLAVRSDLRVGDDVSVNPIFRVDRCLSRRQPLPDKWMEVRVRRPMSAIAKSLPLLEQAQRECETAATLVQGAAHRQRLAYFCNRVTCTHALYRTHLKLAESIVSFQSGLQALEKGDEPGFLGAVKKSLALVREADAEGMVRLFSTFMHEVEGEAESGELGLLISLNVKLVGSLRRMEGRLLVLLGERREEWNFQPENAGLSIRCGAVLQTDVWGEAGSPTGKVGLAKWGPEVDIAHLAPGFGYRLDGAVSAQALTPSLGCWRADRQIELTLTVPKRFSGRLRLYLFQETDVNSPARRQAIFVDGRALGEFADFFCRGEYWDQGIWVETAVSGRSSSGPGEITVKIRRTGTGYVMLSGVELLA